MVIHAGQGRRRLLYRTGFKRRQAQEYPVLIVDLFHCAAVGGYEIESPIVYAAGFSPNCNLNVVY